MTNSNANIPSSTNDRGLSIALWIIQAVLAALFLFSGVMKFVMPVAEMTKGTSLPGPFFHFIGAMEVLGGIGLILPALCRIFPVLTPLAASGLVIIMVGATVTSMSMGRVALLPFCVGMMAAFVAYGRFRLRPIRSRQS